MTYSFGKNELKKKDYKKRVRRRSMARMMAVQALFQQEQAQQSTEEVLNEFLPYSKNMKERFFETKDVPFPDKKLFKHLFLMVNASQEKYDEVLKKFLPEKWPINNIDPVLRALLRAGIAELLEKNTPIQVIINEYVDIAHSFFFSDDMKMVNAILDAVAKDDTLLGSMD